MSVGEISDVGPDDGETVVISWLKPVFDHDNHVSWERKKGAPLPFYIVTNIDNEENIAEGWLDALIEVDVLVHRAAGGSGLRDEADRMHRRMLLLGQHLPDVELDNGVIADIQSVTVFQHPRRFKFEDDQILAKFGRYRIGLSYRQH